MDEEPAPKSAPKSAFALLGGGDEDMEESEEEEEEEEEEVRLSKCRT